MAGNTFGKLLRLTTFGESHGKAIGGVLDGFPAGVSIDDELIKNDLKRRMPGQSDLVSQRKEKDEVEILSGIFEGISLGSPIAFVVWNRDQNPADYYHLKDAFRPSHADFTYESKYGTRDYRGGGRASARETVSRVVGGAFARMILDQYGIKIIAFVKQVSTIKTEKPYHQLDMSKIEESPVRCPDRKISDKIVELIRSTKEQGDTLGGIIQCVVKNVPEGIGEPVFDKLHADLGKAMLSINAVKGFEIGSGFHSTELKGSEHNDLFTVEKGKIITATNYSGGIQGGISNGMDIYFNVAFKPIATLMKDQESVNKAGKKVKIEGKGRHDVCVVPRAVPIVEAMTALVVADHLLRNRISKL
jgi:chorismate synthase